MLLNLIFIIILISLALLGVLVIRDKPKEKANRIFFVLVIFIILWLSSNYLENAPLGLKWNNLFLRLDFAFGPFLTYLFLVFALNFPKSKKYKYFTKILFFPVLFFAFFSLFTSYIIRDVRLINNQLFFELGPLFFGDAAFTLIYFGSGFFKWILDYRTLKANKRLRLLYIFLGSLISVAITLFANLFLQQIVSVQSFRLINFFTIFFVVFTLYAILRHHLFDIRIVIQRTVLYGVTFGFLLIIYSSLTYIFDKFFALVITPAFSSIISAALVLIFYPRFKLYFQKKTDRLFYRYPYDANQVLKKINETCSNRIDFNDFFNCFVSIIEEKVKINKILLVILNKNKEPILIKNHNFSRKLVKYLKITKCPEKIYNYFSHNKHAALLKDDYPILKNTILNDQETIKNQEAFEKSGASLILPVYHKDRLIAFFFLGPKLSEEAYYPQDFQLFNALIDSISLTFENIFLYSELKKYSRNLEEKVTKRTSELEALNINQARFMADIYHELQTPLAVLKGNLSLMSNKRLDEFETAKSFVRMDRSIDRLSNLIKDLIFLSKADVGKVELKKENINFSELALNMHDDSLILVEDKGVRLRTDIEKNISINGDREKIKSLLFNLISNALKFTPNGKEIRMRLFKDNNNAYFEIEDQGIGIAEKDLPNLFSRFYRIDHGSGEKGSGLGLAICKWIAEAHGGEIEVKSELGQGSTFKVSLPL